MAALRCTDLGTIPYREALALQHRCVETRAAGETGDILLLCEHPPVVTIGRGMPPGAPRPEPRPDLDVVEVERGGEATWHGPGQLVGYPIVDLSTRDRDIYRFLRAIEEGLLLACRDLGVEAVAKPGNTGIWASGKKIGSIGIAIKRWVTYHGFALNLTAGADEFAACGIRPCGFDASVMTSIAELIGEPPDRADAVQLVAQGCARTLDRIMTWTPRRELPREPILRPGTRIARPGPERPVPVA
ncbi:MAG: lipoyl(octanoyl) transferase LipB [Planctomycetales bacterium]|nr:lipoyl(octanoyl) transferase LipB [Planctomycetales bacterium]